MNLVPLLQILTSAPSPSWRPSVWTTRSAATCRPSTSASASRASRGTGRWSAEVSPAVQCWFYCTRINAMQHASINRSLQSFLTLYLLFSSSPRKVACFWMNLKIWQFICAITISASSHQHQQRNNRKKNLTICCSRFNGCFSVHSVTVLPSTVLQQWWEMWNYFENL